MVSVLGLINQWLQYFIAGVTGEIWIQCNFVLSYKWSSKKIDIDSWHISPLRNKSAKTHYLILFHKIILPKSRDYNAYIVGGNVCQIYG